VGGNGLVLEGKEVGEEVAEIWKGYKEVVED
jgi:hypothetical protein